MISPAQPGSPIPPLTPSPRDHAAVSGTLSFTAKLLQFLCYFFSGFIYESGVPKHCPPHCHPFSLCSVSRRVFCSDTPSEDTKHEVGTSGPGCRALSRREVPRHKISFFPPSSRDLSVGCSGLPAAAPRVASSPQPALRSLQHNYSLQMFKGSFF